MEFIETVVVIFVLGSLSGWIGEIFYRRFVTMKKWVNPGFLKGPYLPIYGFGTTIAFFISEVNFTDDFYLDFVIKLLIFLIISTILELLGGFILNRIFHLTLWDYHKKMGNFKGFICLTYSILWTLVGAIYYLLIHSRMKTLIIIMNHYNLSFFFFGIFVGIILIDFITNRINFKKIITKIGLFHILK